MAERKDHESDTKDTLTSSDEAAAGGAVGRRSYLGLAGTALGGAATGIGLSGTAGAATNRSGITFQRVVRAVEDLDLDPTGSKPVQAAVEAAAAEDTLILFPEGEYLLSNNLVVESVQNFGIAGEGAVRFRTPSGQKTAVIYRNVERGLLENITLDQQNDRASFVTKFYTSSYIHVKDVTVEGYNELMDNTNVGFKCVPQASSSSGRVILENFVAADGGHLGSYIGGGGGIYVGPGNEGTVELLNCRIEEWPNNGVYASRTPGSVQVKGGVYRNNDVSQVRISGSNSFVRGALLEVDMDSTTNPGIPRNQRCVYLENGRLRNTGGAVLDCDINFVSSPSPGLPILVSGGAGFAEIKNTRILTNIDGGQAIRAARPQATAGGSRPPARKPHDIRIDGLQVTGTAANASAVRIEERPNSYVKNSCLHQTGDDRDGITLVRSDDCQVSESTIDVTGQAVRLEGSTAETTAITNEGSCELPAEAPAVAPDPDAQNRLVVEPGLSDETVTYEFSVSDTVYSMPSTDVHEEVGDSTVSGQILGGTDAFEFSGNIVSFAADGDISVSLNGSPLDLSPWGVTSQARRLSIECGDTEEAVKYEFGVSGGVQTTDANEAQETLSKTGASGEVATGTDAFEFTGTITDFAASGDLDVTVDGEPVDLSTWILPNRLVIDGASTDGNTEYSFEVSGAVTKDPTGGSINEGDTIELSEVEGNVFNGADSYRFSGEITNFFTLDSELEVRLNGAVQDLSQWGVKTRTLRIEAGDTEDPVSYDLSVSQELEATESVDAHETLTAASASGRIYSGVDAYRFAGELDSLSADGDIRVFIDDQPVDLSEYDVVDRKTLRVEPGVSDHTVSYELSVSGELTGTDTVDAHETVGESSVSGLILSGIDEYTFTGSIWDLWADGDIRLFVDGTEIDTTPYLYPNTISIDGAGTDGRSSYSFEVSGALRKDETAGSINSGDVIRDSTADGFVYGGTDGYRFSGDIVSFDLDGDAAVAFDDLDGDQVPDSPGDDGPLTR